MLGPSTSSSNLAWNHLDALSVLNHWAALLFIHLYELWLYKSIITCLGLNGITFPCTWLLIPPKYLIMTGALLYTFPFSLPEIVPTYSLILLIISWVKLIFNKVLEYLPLGYWWLFSNPSASE
jgi:hypothetical protein